MFPWDFDALFRRLTNGRYCLHRKPSEVDRPVTVSEALDRVVETGDKIDETHAGLVLVQEQLDVLSSNVQALMKKAGIEPEHKAPKGGGPGAGRNG